MGLGIKNANELAVHGGKDFIFKESFTIDDSNGADTYYGDWIDGGWANELDALLIVSAVANRVNETINVTVEREFPPGDVETLLTFTEFAAQAAGHQQAKQANTYLGLRWRVKYVAAGTFAEGTSITLVVKGLAKKV